jgi:hypothetical protein
MLFGAKVEYLNFCNKNIKYTNVIFYHVLLITLLINNMQQNTFYTRAFVCFIKPV